MGNLFKIILKNNLTQEKFEYNVENKNSDESLFYNFDINTNNLIDGEYLLQLFDSDDTFILEELLRVGDYKSNKKTYNKNNEYLTYNK